MKNLGRQCLSQALLPEIVASLPEGLDNETRYRFTETIFTNLAGKSALFISQTRDVLDRVDQVCFLENGRIVACGGHAELLRNCRRYSHFIGTRVERA